MTKRRCTGTRKDGKPCGANPLKDRDTCLAHSDAKTRESVGFVANNGLQGRPRRPRVIDRLIQRIDENIDEIIGVYFDGLRAERAVVVGNGPQAYLDLVPDYTERRHSADALLDRGHGKPRQLTEITGEDGGPIRVVEGLNDPKTREALLELVGRFGDARALNAGPDVARRLGTGD